MFIDKIYRGYFDADIFQVSSPVPDWEKVNRIIGRYRKILQDYTPGFMEAESRIPPDLLREMGSAGFFGLSIDLEYGGVGLNLYEYGLFLRSNGTTTYDRYRIWQVADSFGSVGISNARESFIKTVQENTEIFINAWLGANPKETATP